ncbi:unnamed protein product [Calypogeia fissa]
MCGIGLIVSGVGIGGDAFSAEIHASSEPATQQLSQVVETAYPDVEDLCGALKRRGPDHLGGAILHVDPRKQHVKLRGEHPVKQPLEDSAGNLLVYNGEIFDGLEVKGNENDGEVLMSALCGCCGCKCHSSRLVSQCECTDSESHQSVPQVLSKLRGPWALMYWQAVSQTLWFGRDAIGRRSLLIHLPSANDPRLLLTSVASDVREDKAGSFEYWEDLVCGIYSVAFTAADESVTRHANGVSLTKPISSVEETYHASRQEILTGWARKHSWEDPCLRTLLAWDRQHVTPDDKSEQLCNREQDDVNFLEGQECHNLSLHISECELNDSNWQGTQRSLKHKSPVEQVLAVLRQAVKRRTMHIRQHQIPFEYRINCASTVTAPIAVLFSGGLDSMILAALADEFVASECTIDLLNVSFEGDSAPDRITAVSGVAELQGVFPSRRWRLVEVDAKWSDLQEQRVHLQSLICPSNTYMDLNIGTALWLASSGNGQACYSSASDAAYRKNPEDVSSPDSHRRDSELFPGQENGASSARDINAGEMEGQKCQVRSEARVLLVGSGADEQCGGYGRHRTKFRLGGWTALEAEMRLDFNRIWKRNLGRDDRCIADLGKEARFPFLDEDVIWTLLSIPLWDIVDLQQPAGVGDKRILRQVAQKLGLKGAASLPKRAIQFGSRIAQASNCRDFGSNRAANMASAGSATLKLQ